MVILTQKGGKGNGGLGDFADSPEGGAKRDRCTARAIGDRPYIQVRTIYQKNA
jgi:hypothetical protein